MGNVDAKKLLNFQFKASYFRELGKEFLDGDVVSRNIKRLEQTVENLMDSESRSVQFNFQETLRIFQNAYERKIPASKVLVEGTALRGFSYNIVPGNYSFCKYVLDVFDSNWTSSLVMGLIHSTLSNWAEFDGGERKLLVNFLTEHIQNGTSHTASCLQGSLKYLSENGPYTMGHDLRKRGKSIYDCCSNFLLPRNRFSYSYFSDAIVGYYESNSSIDVEELKKILTRHNNNIANKKVLPLVIIYYDKNGKIPSELLKLSMELIGDPFILSKWAPFKDITREEEKNLETARSILVRVISAEFINVFFRTLTDDSRRLEFWLKKTKYITNFRVFGSSYSKSKLTGYVDNNILARHFTITTNNQDTCAMVMIVKDFAIIEFTDVGALYVYKSDNPMYNAIVENRYRVDKMDDLKSPQMARLVENVGDRHFYAREGRMDHRGNWELRLNNWFYRVVLK